MAQPLSTPLPPGLQEATKKSTSAWQHDLESLFHHTKDRFPDVVWDLIGEDDEPSRPADEIYGHKAIVYARAPPSFQNRYFSFRPNGASSPLPYSSSPTAPDYPVDSALSLGLADNNPALSPRTPSPYRPASPSTTIAAPSMAPPTFLRLTTSLNPTIFSNELEYLYTGKGFGEAFDFLFDESREHAIPQGSPDDAEALRLDKLRKDLVFMWRSRLYSDVRISLTGNFGGSHESTTAIFSSHRFILVSRSSYFHTELLGWPNKSALVRADAEPPTIKLSSPPFTPASLHFTLGFIYTGTLVFSHRSYDLSTAFAILRASIYLGLPTLHDEIQARIAQEMLHGLFHAFITFNEYERLTAGRWGTGGCRCRQCARRVPRVLEFALADDVKNSLLDRGARRALVGLFGEGWCNSEFASLPQRIRDSAMVGLGKRTTVQNAFPLLFAAEHALSKLGNQIEPWADTVRDMILTARKAIDDVIAKDAEACFNTPEWVDIMENDGVKFEDGERVEWAMASVLRGVKENFAPTLYQALVSSILLRPHPTEVNAPHLSATSHIRVQVEQTRLELLKWIGHRWLAIRQDRGFDLLEGWALKEISDHIEVPVEDLLNPPAYSKTGLTVSGSSKRAQSGLLLRPISNHPHTSKVDAESEAASSMRVSVLSRSLALREQPSSASMATRDTGLASSRNSVKSVARSTTSRATTSTVSATPQANKRAKKDGPSTISPARRFANEFRAKEKAKERPDSKLTPSIVKPDDYLDEEEDVDYARKDDEENEFDGPSDEERSQGDDDDRVSLAPSENPEYPMDDAQDQTPAKKVLITRASLASVKSATGKTTIDGRSKSSASSKSQSTLRSNVVTTTTNNPSRPNSRGSTRSSRLNVSVTGSGPRARAVPRPISRLSTVSTSVTPSMKSGTTSSRPTSTISTSTTTTTDTLSTFRTASVGSTPTLSRPRRPSTASSIVTTGQRSSTTSSPVQERARKISGASVSSVASATSSIRNPRPVGKKPSAGPSADPGKLSPASAATPRPIQTSTSQNSTTSTDSAKKMPVLVGTLGRKSLQEKKSREFVAPRSLPVPQLPVPVTGLTTQMKPKEVTEDIHSDSEKEISDPAREIYTNETIPRTKPVVNVVNEHKKTGSSASSSSIATLKRKSSTDTVKTLRSSAIPQPSPPLENNRVSKALPPPPLEATRSPLIPLAPPICIDSVVLAESAPRGATLEVGIPCIISSKRKRFKAYARYIGEVEGETGPWVGVEVPMPIGDNWGDTDNVSKYTDERQWHDGSWGGIRYFEIGGMGSEMDYTDDRAPRRRRLDGSGGSFGDSMYGSKGILKREGDQLSITSDRMKRMRSASPAVSDMSGTESRGLFVRPSQVIYVVDAVGADL